MTDSPHYILSAIIIFDNCMIILSTYTLIYPARTQIMQLHNITKMHSWEKKMVKIIKMKVNVFRILQWNENCSSWWLFSLCHRWFWNRTADLHFLCTLLLVCAHISIGYLFVPEPDAMECIDSLVLLTISISVQGITHFD